MSDATEDVSVQAKESQVAMETFELYELRLQKNCTFWNFVTKNVPKSKKKPSPYGYTGNFKYTCKHNGIF